VTTKAMVREAELKAELSQSLMEVAQRDETLMLFSERLAELELALEDTGWQRLTIGGEREFSRDGLRKMMSLARFSFLKNPLIKHGVMVQSAYVWGQGANISSPTEAVNEVTQAFLDHRTNAQELFGHAARLLKEIEQQLTGNLFVALFTNMSNGMVRVRCIHPDEIEDIICNPEDSREVWFYKRLWHRRAFDPTTGAGATETVTEYYPDWKYDTKHGRPMTIATFPVNWDVPIYHNKTGGFSDMRFGVPEVYAALDWARAIKQDLEDYATIRRALARFAWSLTTKGGKGAVAAAKTRLSTTLGNDSTNAEINPPATAGSTFIGGEAADLQPIKTAGAAPNPEEGRRLWLMAGAGMNLPETILSGDVSTGNLATAKTLDRPTELHMQNRQLMWADVYRDLLGYVVDMAAICPNGPLPGEETENEFTGEMEVVLDDDPSTGEALDRTIDVEFPSVLKHDTLEQVNAIVQAATLGGWATAGTMDDRTLSRLLLNAIGEDDIDEMLAELFPEEDGLTTDLGVKDDPMGLPQIGPDGQPIMPDPSKPPKAAAPQNGTGAPPNGRAKPKERALIAALRDFREAVAPIAEQIVANQTAPVASEEVARATLLAIEADKARTAALTHMAEAHSHIAVEGKTAGQLKTLHGASHKNGKPGHDHEGGGFGG